MAQIVPENGSPVRSPLMPGMGGASNGQMPVGTAPTPTGTVMPGTVAQNNTFAPPGSVPVTAAPGVNGLPPGTQQTNNVPWTDGSNTVVGDFKDTYGAGTGTAITDVLQNLGTSTDSAVQATINNTNLEASKQIGNIQASEAASGITPNSSTAALASGDFYSSVNAGLQSTIAGMEQNQEQTLLQTLLSEGSAHGPDPTLLQSLGTDISGVLGIGGSVASAASGVVSAVNPNTDTSFLDDIGALA